MRPPVPGWHETARSSSHTSTGGLQPCESPPQVGVLWFKASTPVDAFEPTLTSLLAALAPTQTVEVIATRPDHGWMLTRDAG